MPICQRLIRAVFFLLALTALLVARQAQACNLDVTFSPPLPTSIPASQTVGSVIYTGVVTYTTTSCNYTSKAFPLGIYSTWGTSALPVNGMTGVSVQTNSYAQIVANNTGNAMHINAQPSFTLFYVNAPRVRDPANFSVAIGLVLTATQSTISGSLPSPTAQATPLASGTVVNYVGSCYAGWTNEGQRFTNAIPCTSYTINGFNSPVINANTCTVSTPSVAVPLPTVSRTSLASAGATAGITPFTLSFSGCSTSTAGFTGTQTWAFTPGPASNVISNSGTATNVYAQILDSSMTSITNGGTTSFSVPAAGGAVSQQFYARYYAGGAAGAGSLNSTATFTTTYN